MLTESWGGEQAMVGANGFLEARASLLCWLTSRGQGPDVGGVPDD